MRQVGAFSVNLGCFGLLWMMTVGELSESPLTISIFFCIECGRLACVASIFCSRLSQGAMMLQVLSLVIGLFFFSGCWSEIRVAGSFGCLRLYLLKDCARELLAASLRPRSPLRCVVLLLAEAGKI